MTKQELNRDIKRLWKRYYNEYRKGDQSTENFTSQDWNEFENRVEEMRNELKRLYFADDDKTSTTHINLKRLIRMNQTLRAISLHHLATNWKLD